jgi:hypothetical protein
MRYRFGRLAVLAATLAVGGCGSETPTGPPATTRTPTPAPPTPDPTTLVVPGSATGPTQIVFVSAEPVPGSTVSGCGARIAGCAGRVRITYALTSPTGGPVLYVRGFLHATNKRACLIGNTGAFQLPAGESRVTVTFDQADDCATPTDIRDMALNVEGPIQTASRQEWSIFYTFAP